MNPVFTATQIPTGPSRKAVELSKKLAEAVRILRQDDPSIGSLDVIQGLRLAEIELRREIGERPPYVRIVFAVLVTSLLAMGFAFLVASQRLEPNSLAFYAAMFASTVGSALLLYWATRRKKV